MKKLGIATLLGAFVVSSLAMFATSAWAVPVFARKYNVACSLCHTIPPRLTKAGVAFKENGFEMPSALPQSDRFSNAVLAEDEPRAEVPAGIPLTLRTGLNIGISKSDTFGAGTVAASKGATAMTANAREFGLIGGGNIGGVGFWIDAPSATFGAIESDFKFTDMAKVRVGIYQPNSTINYGLGLQPMALDPGLRNPVAMLSSGALAYGDSTAVGAELRGTTDATNGLAFNYSVGYTFSAGLPGNDPIAIMNNASATPENAFYGGLGYLVDAINTYLGVSYTASSNVGGVSAANGNTLLATATYNPGDAFMIIFAYNTTNSAVVAPAASVNANGWSIQPEYSFGNWWLGARYASINNYNGVGTLPGAALNTLTGSIAVPGVIATGINTSYVNAGVGYRLLQNTLLTVNYSSASNNSTVANTVTGVNGVSLGLDLIL